jgi:hypothetical protein
MRLTNKYYSTFAILNVLTDDEYNELVNIEEVFNILSNKIPDDTNSQLSRYISSYLVERNRRSWYLCGVAHDRVKNILELCTK